MVTIKGEQATLQIWNSEKSAWSDPLPMISVSLGVAELVDDEIAYSFLPPAEMSFTVQYKKTLAALWWWEMMQLQALGIRCRRRYKVLLVLWIVLVAILSR